MVYAFGHYICSLALLIYNITLDALDAIKTRFGCTFAIIKRIFKKYDTQIRSGTIWPDLSTTKCIVKAEKKAKITSLAERCQHSRVKKRCWECRPGKRKF